MRKKIQYSYDWKILWDIEWDSIWEKIHLKNDTEDNNAMISI